MSIAAHSPGPDHDRKEEPTDPARKPARRPSEEPLYRPDDGKGGTYEKEGTQPSKGSEMPDIEERTGKDT
ncbi:MAG: hypothetical protein IPL77_07085 [Flavobacteriales bacterium]|nr:hypothetical protein [Flavobacteriales bacterium]